MAESIDAAREKERYDAACKRVLSEKVILAWIMKSCLDEYKNSEVSEIASQYIVGEPIVSRIAVAPDETNVDGRIRGIGTEDATLTESRSTYDIRFYAIAPESGEQIELIVNVEVQNTDHPGYPLPKRGIYYGSRMISSQYGVEFTHSEYGMIKKVYSIWICLNPAEKRKNSVVRYSIREENLIGNVREKVSDYDLMTVVILYLGDEASEPEGDILRLLNALLGTESSAEQKKAFLRERFAIPMTKYFEQEVSEMCNLSDGVEQKGIQKGIEKGRQEGKIMAFAELVRDGVLSLADAAKFISMSPVDFCGAANELGYRLS